MDKKDSVSTFVKVDHCRNDVLQVVTTHCGAAVTARENVPVTKNERFLISDRQKSILKC